MTNREILMKLAEGKKMRLPSWNKSYYIYMNTCGRVIYGNSDAHSEELCNLQITEISGWQEVVEPLQWEKEYEVSSSMGVSLKNGENIGVIECLLPPQFIGRRVKVTVEELVND